MSAEIPEDPTEPIEEPAPPPPCSRPDLPAYRNAGVAAVVIGRRRGLVAEECPAGHWHVVSLRTGGDGVPNPEQPAPSEADPA